MWIFKGVKDLSAKDKNYLSVFGGNFPSREFAEEYMAITDGRPKRFMDELFLAGGFSGSVELKFFETKSNRAEELYRDFPYGDKIIEVMKAKFDDKLKRRVNTAIVLYDFDWSGHFSSHFLSQMKEKRTEEYHIFHVSGVYPYK